jgi:hypothetical protein
VGVGREEAVAEFGEHGFERVAEAVEDADAVLEGHDVWAEGGGGGRSTLYVVRVVRAAWFVGWVDEEGGAADDVGGEEADAGVGCVPAFDDDEVELVAEELIDDGLILAVDFEEVGEGTDGGEAGLAGAGDEEVAHSVSGVAVLTDEADE